MQWHDRESHPSGEAGAMENLLRIVCTNQRTLGIRAAGPDARILLGVRTRRDNKGEWKGSELGQDEEGVTEIIERMRHRSRGDTCDRCGAGSVGERVRAKGKRGNKGAIERQRENGRWRWKSAEGRGRRDGDTGPKGYDVVADFGSAD